MRMPILFGTETEYAVTALGRDDLLLPLEGILTRIQDRAAVRPCLPASESGVFYANGARVYRDGQHPEYSTPEAGCPFQAVRHALAGDRLIAQLAHEVIQSEPRIASLVVRKGNVDYARQTTWGSHENYLHRCPAAHLRPALIPHLVSRVVFTGAGGFDPTDHGKLRFVLSPRAQFVRRVVATSALGAIALVDERAQPHCVGYHRQHVMCGDASQSQLAMLLRTGTTALVVALIDAGFIDDQAVSLVDPLAALTIVTRDITMRQSLELQAGGSATAVEIQRYYLQQARAHCSVLPEWADRVCDLWQDTLDRLERGPDAVDDRLDWAIKLTCFRQRARTRRKESTNPWPDEMREMDLRYGQIYPPSLFDALDRAGVLHHQVAGIGDVDAALSTPPSEGRARIRGSVVMRLAAQCDGSSCAWDQVKDVRGSRTLDLSNPFVETEVWRDLAGGEEAAGALVARLAHLLAMPASPAAKRSIRAVAGKLGCARGTAPPGRHSGHAIQLNNHAIALRNAGRLDEAEWLMRAALGIDLADRHDRHPKVCHRRNNLGTVLLMQGRVAEARELVIDAWPQAGGRHDLTSLRVLTIRLAIALVDDEPCEFFLGQLKTHLALRPLPDFAEVDRCWQMAPALSVLASRVATEDMRLLHTVVDVINGNLNAEALLAIPVWVDVPAKPLCDQWPPGDT